MKISLLLALILANPDIVKSDNISSLIYTNIMIPYFLYLLEKMVHNVFWTGSEYKIMHSFIV